MANSIPTQNSAPIIIVPKNRPRLQTWPGTVSTVQGSEGGCLSEAHHSPPLKMGLQVHGVYRGILACVGNIGARVIPAPLWDGVGVGDHLWARVAKNCARICAILCRNRNLCSEFLVSATAKTVTSNTDTIAWKRMQTDIFGSFSQNLVRIPGRVLFL